SSRRRHTRFSRDWSSDVCSSDLSNACYFHGENIKEATPSLAYILGDEGSGCYMGKKLVHAYFSKKMPKDLEVKFKEQYELYIFRSEERRVGKERKYRWWNIHFEV